MVTRTFFSSRALSYIRSRAIGQMFSTCVIERVLTPDWDQATNLVTAGDRTVIYTGVCRIWELSGPSVVAVADDVIVLQSTNLSIPWDTAPIPRRDDEVQVLSSLTDTDLVGRRYRILDEAKGGDLRATRRFQVQGTEEHR